MTSYMTGQRNEPEKKNIWFADKEKMLRNPAPVHGYRHETQKKRFHVCKADF